MSSSRRSRPKRKPNQTQAIESGAAPCASNAASAPAASGTPAASPPPPVSPRRQWGYRLAAATLIPALFFVVIELVLRIAGVGYNTDFFTLRKFGPDRVYTENPRFGWQFFPRSLARQPYNFVLSERKSPEALRIFVLGGSAAMGDPDPSFSLARSLDVLLTERFPEKRFEVVNAAMTGVNSHVMRRAAADCAQHQPDYFVVYMGNNEVIGPYGPGTVFGSFSRSLSAVRFALWLKTTKWVQAMEEIKARGETPDEFKEWGGLRMFLKNLVRADDPKLDRMYAHFRVNLGDIAASAHRAGARTLLCTVPTNLRDCAPFAAVPAPGATGEQRNAVETLREEGVRLRADGDAAEAIARFESALDIAPDHPELHYRLGKIRLGRGEAEAAREHFRAAREYDALRFRADDTINETIRAVARDLSGRGTRLVDALAVFEAQADNGIPGEDLFVDHVHLNFDATYLLARSVAESIASDLEPDAGNAEENHRLLSRDDFAVLMGYTPWAEYDIATMMLGRLTKPPFTNQLDHGEQVDRLQNRIKTLSVHATAKGVDDAIAIHRRALARRPFDWTLRENLARLLQSVNRPDEEIEQWQAILAALPHARDRHALLGQSLARAGRFEEAIAACRTALEADPKNVHAYNGLGIAYAGQGEADRAIENFRTALRLRPTFIDARNNLAHLLMRLGEDQEAIAQYTGMLLLDPDDAEAHHQLALLSVKREDVEQAYHHFKEAERLAPYDATLQFHLGLYYAATNQTQEAIDHFRRAIDFNPGLTEAHVNLGVIYAKQERYDDASIHFDIAVKQSPNDPAANFNMGFHYEGEGEVELALRHYQRVVRVDPSHLRAHYRIGLCHEGLGQFPQAIAKFKYVLERDPNWPEVQNELAWVYSTRPESTPVELEEAVRLAETANEATNHEEPTYLDTLATAYAAVGRFEEAMQYGQLALEIAKHFESKSLANEIEKRLALFEARQPYTGD